MRFMWIKWVLLILFGYWNANEIVVFGLENLALHKPTRQTSNFADWSVSDYVVDGNLTTNDLQCAHSLDPTDDSPNWLLVDLEAQYEITKIALLNRDSDYAYRLGNFTVSVWQYDPGPHIKYNMVDTEYSVCVYYPSIAPRATWTTLTCTKKRLGRFVLLVMNNPLSVCEFEVYGDIYNGCSTQNLPELYIKKVVGKRSSPPNCPLLPYEVANVFECSHRCLQMNNCTSFNYSPHLINTVNCQLVQCFSFPQQDFTVDNEWNWRYLSYQSISVQL